MTQRTKPEWKTEIARLFVNNTTGNIEADEVLTVLDDLADSVDFITPAAAPSVMSFSIQGQDTRVDPGTTLSGTVTFLYNISNPAGVSGNLTITQGVSTLSSTVNPNNNSVSLGINSITLNAGESVTFNISGTDGVTPFDLDFIVTARTDDEFVYFGNHGTNDPSTFAFASAGKSPFTDVSQKVTIPAYVGNDYIVIAQRADKANLTEIIVDGIDAITDFNLTENAFTVNSQNFDAWVSANELDGSLFSNDIFTLVR